MVALGLLTSIFETLNNVAAVPRHSCVVTGVVFPDYNFPCHTHATSSLGPNRLLRAHHETLACSSSPHPYMAPVDFSIWCSCLQERNLLQAEAQRESSGSGGSREQRE
ncbi:hypothetical protein GOP47_0018056 [Adiantum capillus-veneris]|uniref:Secreted protein n=1 Tax=Adiantum capillus-veneris TaxID=13818 RepID=A0A9D4UGJ7_ADICA|nr:hypothetical protein GOP47_0018056 [Adiantum capillus-veneris]